jgi:hypothetical protein
MDCGPILLKVSISAARSRSVVARIGPILNSVTSKMRAAMIVGQRTENESSDDATAKPIAPKFERETVILVHGTFAAPDPSCPQPQWYEPGSTYVSKLDVLLEQLNSPARCWAHLRSHDSKTDKMFWWSGANTWAARSEAAARLSQLISSLAADGWRCHLVAHSHGGNVALEALNLISASPTGWPGCTVTTLSTPFIETWTEITSSAAEARFRKADVAKTILFIGILLAILILLLPDSFGVPWLRSHWWTALKTILLGVVGLIVVAIATFLALLYWPSKSNGVDESKSNGVDDFDMPQRMLNLNSKEDEAFQLLAKVASQPNPFALPWRGISGAIRSFVASWKALSLELSEKDKKQYPWQSLPLRLFLAATLAMALVWPALPDFDDLPLIGGSYRVDQLVGLSWVGILIVWSAFMRREMQAELRYPGRAWRKAKLRARYMTLGLGTVLFRKYAWTYLQRMALGLENFPFEIGKARERPTSVRSYYRTFESYSYDDVKHALSRREAGIAAGVQDITEALSRAEFAAIDANMILKEIAHDIELVHAVGYASEWAIERTAKWIARSEEKLKADSDRDWADYWMNPDRRHEIEGSFEESW